MKGTFFSTVFFIFLLVTLSSFTTKGLTMKDNGDKVQKRLGSLIKVRPEFEERYIILHRNTFPGVLESINKSNIRNYTIFLLDGMLFSYYEYIGNDFDADMKAIANPVTKDWWKLTDPMQEPLSTRKEGEWWAEMDEIFFLPGKMKDSQHTIRVGVTAEIKSGQEEGIKKCFADYSDELKKETYSHGFQNANIFMKDGRLYYYYEYAGNDIIKSFRELTNTEVFKNFQTQLNQYLVPQKEGYWNIMKEVFHTD
jgi:L-rhamnose mutarotase